MKLLNIRLHLGGSIQDCWGGTGIESYDLSRAQSIEVLQELSPEEFFRWYHARVAQPIPKNCNTLAANDEEHEDPMDGPPQINT